MENNQHTQGQIPRHSWDQMPSILYELSCKVDNLMAIVNAKNDSQPATPDQRFDIDGLLAYLPGNVARSTIYGKVQRKEIPHDRMGKRLTFLKSEIDAWLNSHKGKTLEEIKADALQRTAQPTASGRKPITTKVERKGSRTATV